MNPVYFRVILYFIAPLVALVPGIVYDANAQTVTIDLEAAATGLAVAGAAVAAMFAKWGKK
ncbi:hypothetical protein [uncultured Roseovarius sp.]|uniref:hypothetical protein n=1 Tax=uncultured Roseovarius sp. TaxID=293344 RepID=UPI000C649291|nr:hypothetical protein [Roseovarius sp.]MBD11554.1 hypothetical protein [Roseovarius sp.]|tara:strand:- start:1312 stop:1494 length:183 start_codon:yes stop_codon:yes gene_type:complete